MRRQRGIALVVSLVLLIMVMLLGVSAAQLCLQSARAARGERDRDVAFRTAEDALKDAELDIENGSDPARRKAFASGDGFVEDCGAGLRERAAAGETPVWQAVDLSGGVCTVPYGAYTGAAMATGQGFLPFKKPQYLIERMTCHQPGDDASTGAPPRYCYRVTAMGFGAGPQTEVVLQSVYNKPEEAP